MLNGIHAGWCIDIGHYIYSGTYYSVDVYSSYEDLSGVPNIDHPENLDKVNWILNQGFIGTACGACGGDIYTKYDVQRVIWELIDDSQHIPGYPWSQCKADEIYDQAMANGVGFVPGCGDRIAVVLDTDVGDQITIIDVPFRHFSDETETAWGEGMQFNPNAGWAMYFEYIIQTIL